MKKIVALFSAVLILLSTVVVAFAATTTPSVQTKDAVDVVVIKENETGDPQLDVVAEVRNQKELEQDIYVPELWITSYAESKKSYKDYKTIKEEKNATVMEEAEFIVISDLMKSAYESIDSVEFVADVNGGKSDLKEELKKRAEKLADETGKDFTEENYVVSELFDLNVEEQYIEMAKAEEKFVRVTFKKDYVGKMKPTILYRCEGDTDWSIVPENQVTVNADHTLTVDFDRLCPIAFLDVTEPEVGFSWFTWILVILLIVVTILILVFVVFRNDDDKNKKKAKKSEEKTAA